MSRVSILVESVKFSSVEKTIVGIDEKRKKVTLKAKGFLNVREFDFVSASIDEDSNIDMTTVVVRPAHTTESITKIINEMYRDKSWTSAKVKGKTTAKAKDLIDCICQTHKIEEPKEIAEKINDCIERSSMLCCKTHYHVGKMFMKFWNTRQNVRTLHNLGMTNRDISTCKQLLFKNDVTLVRSILKSPLCLVCLDHDTVENVSKRVSGKDENYIDEQKGGDVFDSGMSLYNKYKNYGHCFFDAMSICENSSSRPRRLEKHCRVMNDQRPDINGGEKFLMFKIVYETNKELAQNIKAILHKQAKQPPVLSSPIDSLKDMNEFQQKAFISCLSQPVTVIQGPAGSGKTTFIIANLVNSIVEQFGRDSSSFLILSYTGKSVSHLKSVLKPYGVSGGIYTVHKSLTPKVISIYKKSDSTTLKFVIFDESSMLNTSLLNTFFRIYGTNFRAVFVGDVNQIPPIAPGRVFPSLLNSSNPSISVVKLETVHRTNKEGLLEAFQKVIKGEPLLANRHLLVVDNDPYEYVTDCTKKRSILSAECFSDIDSVVKEYTKGYTDFSDIKIVCPYKVFVEQINDDISSRRKDQKILVTDFKDRNWREGDMIMFLKNCYNRNTYNGDEGIVKEYSKASQSLIVTTLNGEKRVLMRRKNEDDDEDDSEDDHESDSVEAEKLPDSTTELFIEDCAKSYCSTIDKSQGSQYSTLVLVLPDVGNIKSDVSGEDRVYRKAAKNNRGFLNRQRLYTAITRAKERVILVGSLAYFNRLTVGEVPEPNTNLNVLLM